MPRPGVWTGRRRRASTIRRGSKIDLPHDWAVELPFVNNPILVEHGAKPLGREYPETSIGWYRREFVLPASDAGRRICVEFDGIFRNATVFFNGHYMTQNMSGYAPVALDLTDFANFGGCATTPPAGAPAAGLSRRRDAMCWWCGWTRRWTRGGSTRARASIAMSG